MTTLGGLKCPGCNGAIRKIVASDQTLQINHRTCGRCGRRYRIDTKPVPTTRKGLKHHALNWFTA